MTIIEFNLLPFTKLETEAKRTEVNSFTTETNQGLTHVPRALSITPTAFHQQVFSIPGTLWPGTGEEKEKTQQSHLLPIVLSTRRHQVISLRRGQRLRDTIFYSEPQRGLSKDVLVFSYLRIVYFTQ